MSAGVFLKMTTFVEPARPRIGELSKWLQFKCISWFRDASGGGGRLQSCILRKSE